MKITRLRDLEHVHWALLKLPFSLLKPLFVVKAIKETKSSFPPAVFWSPARHSAIAKLAHVQAQQRALTLRAVPRAELRHPPAEAHAAVDRHCCEGGHAVPAAEHLGCRAVSVTSTITAQDFACTRGHRPAVVPGPCT